MACVIAVASFVASAAIRNAFVEVDGAPGAAVDGTMFSVTGDTVRIRVTPRPGWRLTSPADQTLGPGESGYWSVMSLLKEDEEHGYICHPSETVTTNHLHTPAVTATASAGGPYVYAAPSNGCFGTVSGRMSRFKNGVHVVTNIVHTCPGTECDGVATNVEEAHVGMDCFEWKWPGGHTNAFEFHVDDIWLQNGTNYLFASLAVTNDTCGECKTSFITNMEAVASLLSVTCPPYLGIDRTDEMRGKLRTREAEVTLSPDQSDITDIAWTCEALCEYGKKNGRSLEYGTADSDAHSALWNDQEICAAIGSVTATVHFTVVRLDVEIGGVGEDDEEKIGCLLYCAPDAPNGEWTEEGTNALVGVSITCEPDDGAMQNEEVIISVPDGFLFVKNDAGTYTEAAKSYKVKDLNKTRFWLHGHERSKKYLGGEIIVTHRASEAVDKARFTVFGCPWLVPDYDRDGIISEERDVPKAKDGMTVFRFWRNDDDDDGSSYFEATAWWPTRYANGSINKNSDNQPKHEEDGNFNNNVVDGYSDLLDFTPVVIDASEVFPENTPDELINNAQFLLKSDCVNVVWTSLCAEDANIFLAQAAKCYGKKLKSYQYEAEVCNLENETHVHAGLTEKLRKKEKVVVLIEGRATGEKFSIEVRDDKSTRLAAGSLKLRVSPVERMYRWMDLRYASINLLGGGELCAAAKTECNGMNEPENGPDSDCNGDPRDGRHFVFIHGYNINSDEARAWGAEMYKRLWQSGMSSKFTVVDWVGDAGQFGNRDDGTSVSYHFAVPNAFLAAKALKEQVLSKIGNNATLMAHSLGNIVASSAIADWDLEVEKYYLLNAAVARQAYGSKYDTEYGLTAEDMLMIDEDWNGVKKKYWASYWFTNFNGMKDFRAQLRWVGIFGRINNAINCFSPTDDIIHNIEQPMFGSPSLGSPWTMQEKLKGSIMIRGIDDLAKSSVGMKILDFFGIKDKFLHTEAGWGVNPAWGGRKYLTKWSSDVNGIPFKQLVQKPLFVPFATFPRK